MTDFHLRSPEALKREVSADGGSLFTVMWGLWPYIWPTERRELKIRVGLAMVLLLAAKLATIAVPFTFKWATDALTGEDTAPVGQSAWFVWLLAAPSLMTIAYGGMRILMAVLTQARDGIFAKVAMNAVRRLAYMVFEHMHKLSLRFHLERKTGGLTRVLERGRNAIETIVRMVIMQLVPTVIELSFIIVVLLYQFDWRYVVLIVVTVACYMVYTYFATEWRIGIRRRMNDSDSDANVKAIDSLLNYETVKYFVAEEREARRYDRAMARYEEASVKSYVSLAVLNAGQATISRLLYRFYDVTGGRIEIDGQDIRDVTQVSLRSAIGMVPQDTVLFNDTIRYNIRYGRWEATDAEVEEAARHAQIDHFIRVAPKGYETEVGERGLKLSGGEKQRVAIARTILKGPPILLLDEATSALDSHTEREIQDALDRVSRNRTTLVIAHRLSTIVGADEIIVLDQGAIVERGTHHGLLAKGGLYASMWNRQREAEAAREKLALVDDEVPAPNRNAPLVEDVIAAAEIESADAAE